MARIPNSVSAGSSIGIGTEKLLVLNAFKDRSILRVKRGAVSGVHTVGTKVNLGQSTIAAISSFSSIGGLKWTDQIVAADTWTEQTVASDTWTNQTNPTTTWTELNKQEVS